MTKMTKQTGLNSPKTPFLTRKYTDGMKCWQSNNNILFNIIKSRMNIHSKWSKPWIIGGNGEKKCLFHNNTTNKWINNCIYQDFTENKEGNDLILKKILRVNILLIQLLAYLQ